MTLMVGGRGRTGPWKSREQDQRAAGQSQGGQRRRGGRAAWGPASLSPWPSAPGWSWSRCGQRDTVTHTKVTVLRPSQYKQGSEAVLPRSLGASKGGHGAEEVPRASARVLGHPRPRGRSRL